MISSPAHKDAHIASRAMLEASGIHVVRSNRASPSRRGDIFNDADDIRRPYQDDITPNSRRHGRTRSPRGNPTGKAGQCESISKPCGGTVLRSRDEREMPGREQLHADTPPQDVFKDATRSYPARNQTNRASPRNKSNYYVDARSSSASSEWSKEMSHPMGVGLGKRQGTSLNSRLGSVEYDSRGGGGEGEGGDRRRGGGGGFSGRPSGGNGAVYSANSAVELMTRMNEMSRTGSRGKDESRGYGIRGPEVLDDEDIDFRRQQSGGGVKYDDYGANVTEACTRRVIPCFSVTMPHLETCSLDVSQMPEALHAAIQFLVMIDIRQKEEAVEERYPTQSSSRKAGFGYRSAGVGGMHRGLLPPLRGPERPTLVLDMDETLIHTSAQPYRGFEYKWRVNFDETTHGYVYERPFCGSFLEAVCEAFEVVVFTASTQYYADQVLDQLDPSGSLIQHRLYREHCTQLDGAFTKDLTLLDRPLSNIIIVDNSPISFAMQVNNAVPISSWYYDPKDSELISLLHLLKDMMMKSHGRFPDYLAQRYGLLDFLNECKLYPNVL
eukprot:GHVU01209931.1.p1 GENE.GHVU01209931.1~~GHVU01209931.1.p1  ORF type:complete len:553 (+),score=50.71 GHVU01209931.1:2670-4328(+)